MVEARHHRRARGTDVGAPLFGLCGCGPRGGVDECVVGVLGLVARFMRGGLCVVLRLRRLVVAGCGR